MTIDYNRYNVVQQISRTYSSCLTETLYLLISNSLFPFPLAPGNHYHTLCFCEFNYFLDFTFLDFSFYGLLHLA